MPKKKKKMARFSLGMIPFLNKFFIEIRIINFIGNIQKNFGAVSKILYKIYIEKSSFFFSHYVDTFCPNFFGTRFIFRSLLVPCVTARDLLSEE